MIKKLIFIGSILLNFIFILEAQPINVSNIVTTGRFNTCGILPTITATFISGNGSLVQNGALACVNPNDSSLINLTFSNLRWNQSPDQNWLHSVYFLNNLHGIRIISNSLVPPNWIFKNNGCTGMCPNGGQIQGGPGYYFDGSIQSSCCNLGNNSLDGNPCNNYGDTAAKCTRPYAITYLLKIRNFNIRNVNALRIYGSSDGNTGCWAIADQTINSITFQFEGLVCPVNPVLCNPVGNAILKTNLNGPFQWQLSTDSILFNNITDNVNYSGTNTANLSLSNIASNRYGEQFRCIANGISDQVFTLKFNNTWKGTINSDWNTAGNWSCGSVPDSNTDVFINFGTVLVSTNASVRSLTINPPGNLTVAPGVVFTVTH